MSAKKIVIVESPAKANTINKYLGKDYLVTSSMGHIRDLPQSKLGIDIDKGFVPEYTVIKLRKKLVQELKKMSLEAEHIYLAPDPDREGEAIAWHIAEVLKRKGVVFHRVTFNEITREAVLRAFEHPGAIDEKKVESQQARRILDRLVGYKISPLLWRKVGKGLSAGRVQSVALKMICIRDRDIQEFKPQEYWTITALLKDMKDNEISADLVSVDGKKPAIQSKEESEKIIASLSGAQYVVDTYKEESKKRQPPPPFITSTLQQGAHQALRWPISKVMKVAQTLYEGVTIDNEQRIGFITYMRTDSTRISEGARAQAEDLIRKLFGKEYVGVHGKKKSSAKHVQDAHECIRPTNFDMDPERAHAFLTSDQYALYTLIWERFIQSLMADAVIGVRTVDIQAGRGSFRTSSSVVAFPGFMRYAKQLLKQYEKEQPLSVYAKGDEFTLISLDGLQHFTKPPAYFTEATLVKALEDEGVGRPSTYASILMTLYARNYVEKDKGKLKASSVGFVVNDLLDDNFPKIMNVRFTAEIEKHLDQIEQGENKMEDILKDFYTDFEEQIERAVNALKDKKIEIKSEEVCDKCGKPMIFKLGRHGKYLACSAYPECRNTKPVPSGVLCPQPGCGGDMIKKRSRAGKYFYGCGNYPKCTFTARTLSQIKGKPNEDIKDTAS